ncbi:alpha/beta hydrolase [Massilia sp. H-1]|nr:alpha/beta hydrolase [Massilia sp. H-1]
MRIGGIEQWVTISGTNCANPIVLVVHGGPGNPMTPYSDAIYGAWTKQFTIVQWDQRGSGRTYGRNRLLAERDSRKWTMEQLASLPPLTIPRLTQDGVEVASYVAARLNQRKVILVGGSWGSALGVHMAKARPDLFHAYVGTGQIVHYTENGLSTYEKLLGLARAAKDTQTVATLESLGAAHGATRAPSASCARRPGSTKRKPPPRRPNSGGRQLRCSPPPRSGARL